MEHLEYYLVRTCRLFYNSLGPRRRIGRPRATTGFVCLERWARGRQSSSGSSSSNQGMEIAEGGNQRMKLAQPKPSVRTWGGRGRSILGAKAPESSTTDERGLLREAGGKAEPYTGGLDGRRGRSEHGDSNLSLVGPDAISEMGARARGRSLPWKRKAKAGMGLGGGQHQ